MDSERVVTFMGGQPFNDTSLHKWYVVESDEQTFAFTDFDIEAGSLTFTLDGERPVQVPLEDSGESIARLELSTEVVGARRQLRLARYSHYVSVRMG